MQGESSNEPQGKPEYIPVENLQKTASLSPSRFVELLRTHRDYLPLHGFFSDNDRLFFYDEDVEPVRALDVLSGITVHYLDWKNFILEMEKEGREKIESNGDGALPEDVSDLEPQLAEAQKHIEALEQWNKRLNEQNKKLRPELAEKNSRIAELESLLAISAESKGKRDNSAAIIGKLRKDLQRWKTAFPLRYTPLKNYSRIRRKQQKRPVRNCSLLSARYAPQSVPNRKFPVPCSARNNSRSGGMPCPLLMLINRTKQTMCMTF